MNHDMRQLTVVSAVVSVWCCAVRWWCVVPKAAGRTHRCYKLLHLLLLHIHAT